jgi:hypothetical protein
VSVVWNDAGRGPLSEVSPCLTCATDCAVCLDDLLALHRQNWALLSLGGSGVPEAGSGVSAKSPRP